MHSPRNSGLWPDGIKYLKIYKATNENKDKLLGARPNHVSPLVPILQVSPLALIVFIFAL
jgi:hypothetical protein